MKRKPIYTALIILVFASSCASVYRSGQTPDDVYAAPSPQIISTQQGEQTYTEPTETNSNGYSDNYQSNINKDDNYLRMRASDRNRWNSIDDYSYWNDSRYDYYYYNPYNPNYGINAYGGFGNYYNNFNGGYNSFGYYCTPQWNNYWGFYNYHPSYYGWGGYYNPYFGYYNVGNNGYGANQNYTKPKISYSSGSNLTPYKNNNYNNSYNSNPSSQNTISRSINTTPSPSNNNTGRVYVDRPARTYTPTNNNAGGRSGGFNSTGSSSSKPRAPKH